MHLLQFGYRGDIVPLVILLRTLDYRVSQVSCNIKKQYTSASTVCLFSNETKNDGINQKLIKVIIFYKKYLKEYVLAFVSAKS